MLIEKKAEILANFKCQNSGNCCKASGFVYVSAENIQKMADILNLDLSQFKETFVQKDNGWEVVASQTFRPNCFLDDQHHCTVYEGRPTACKTYPNWPSIWQTDEALIAESTQCPGLKQAITLTKNL
jgi:Fe-S-cluster containining protein